MNGVQVAQSTRHFEAPMNAGSYQETLDCPAMSGMRAVEDVIEGHKSVGVFDPQFTNLPFGIPSLDFRGTPTGIDIRKVVRTA